VVATSSAVGGGALPLAELPSWALALPVAAEPALRAAPVPVIGRISDDRLLLDVRTIAVADEPDVIAAVRAL
jgi:L-seryl-tRNA(Ser) seleniumtransferase